MLLLAAQQVQTTQARHEGHVARTGTGSLSGDASGHRGPSTSAISGLDSHGNMLLRCAPEQLRVLNELDQHLWEHNNPRTEVPKSIEELTGATLNFKEIMGSGRLEGLGCRYALVRGFCGYTNSRRRPTCSSCCITNWSLTGAMEASQKRTKCLSTFTPEAAQREVT
jgi:hypothetical protein